MSITGLTAGVSYTFRAFGVDRVGNVGSTVSRVWSSGGCPSTFTIQLTSLRTTFVTNGVRAMTWSTTADSIAGVDVAVEYRLDNDTEWTRSTQGVITVPVSTGAQHTLYTRVAVPSGCDAKFSAAAPLSATWYEYDVAPGVVSFSSTPPVTTPVPFGDFTIASTSHPQQMMLQYALDGSAWIACDTSFRVGPLSPGYHNVTVRALDVTGATSSSIVVHEWTVESSSGSSLALTIPDDGQHTLSVWAIDALGNRDTHPALWSWVLDTAPPVTIASLTNNRTATNAVVVAVDVACGGEQYPVLCSVCWSGAGVVSGDGCSGNSTLLFEYVRDGFASLALWSHDAAGNVAVRSASLSWTWDTVPPDTVANVSLNCSVDGSGTVLKA